MSQAHLDFVNAQLSIGLPEGATARAADLGFDEAAIIAAPEGYEFDADDSYCPQTDVPDSASVGDVKLFSDGRLYFIGDSGMPPYGCLVCFRLSPSSPSAG
jgi:hypothetical protein